jgi:hypothetical protein
MTEQQWLECMHPGTMLEFLLGKASDRKLRLFAVACCRRIWHLLPDERSRKGVEVAERYADGQAGDDELKVAAAAAWAAASYQHAAANSWTEAGRDAPPWIDDEYGGSYHSRSAAAAEAAGEATWADDEYGGSYHAGRLTYQVWYAVGEAPSEYVAQCRLLRDIAGNPFRSASLDAAWLSWGDSTIRKLAQAIYSDRAFDRLPILADALEEAGCTHPDILEHCRGPGPHVRGCFVVDLVLRKN